MKVCRPEEFGRIVAYENVHFSSGNYETRSWKLADEMKMQCWVKFERSYSYLLLATVCGKIARTSVKVRNTKLLPLVLLRAQKRVSEEGLKWPLVYALRWDDWRTSVTTLHVSVVRAILGNAGVGSIPYLSCVKRERRKMDACWPRWF